MNLLIRQKNGKYKGSYTVEAALVMGIITMVMAALLIVCFYLHDKAVLQAMTCEIALAGNNTVTEKEQQKVISDLKKKLNRNRLMGSRNTDKTVKADKKAVNAVCRSEFPVPGMTARFISNNKMKIEVSWKTEKVQAAELIRKIRGVRKLMNGGNH